MRITYVVGAVCLIACGQVEKSHDAGIDSPPDAALPAITSIAPARGIVSTQVTISGTNFGSATGSVTVDGTGAFVSGWTDTGITVTIPDVLPGAVDVVVTAGGHATPPSTFTVILPPAIYLENDVNGADGFDSVTALSFDETTGAVTQIGAPVTMGTPVSSYGGCSTSIWVNAHTRRLFAAAGGKFAIYNINATTGALTPVSGSPFDAGGTRNFAVRTNAAGTRVFVDNYGSSNVGVFDLANDGTPTPVAGSPFATPLGSDTFALSKDETYLYVNQYGGNYAGMSVAANGALAALPGTNVGGNGIMLRPGANQLMFASTMLGVWNIAADGSVAQITGSPFTIGTTGQIQTGAFTADGNRVYFGEFGAGRLDGFSVASDGTPTPLAGSPWTFMPALTSISCVAVSQDAAHLLAVDESGQRIGVYTLDASGTPTQIASSPFTFLPATANVSGMAITF